MPESASKTDTTSIKKQQRRNLFIGLSAAGLGFVGIYSFFEHQAPPPAVKVPEKTIQFASPVDQVKPQEVWLARAQGELHTLTQTTQTLDAQLKLLQQFKTDQDKTAQDQTSQLHTLQEQMGAVQQKLADKSAANVALASSLTSTPGNAGTLCTPGDASSFNITTTPQSSIHTQTLKLKAMHSAMHKSWEPHRNPKTFVPAGTFVRAIALGGADASAGVTSQANPSPMLFRLLDRGTLPNYYQSQLKNCIATAAVMGDVSSERGQIRLERLSCIKPTGEVVEMPVEATIFGPDGKNGVRGRPVWREGALLRRAFAAGTLSGLSNGLSQSFTCSSMNAWGNAQTSVDNNKMLHYGLASGLSNAAEKLAEYNIKRAEQYHPVIQLTAGTIVDIVFLKGFYLDGRKATDNEADLLAGSAPNLNLAATHNTDGHTDGDLLRTDSDETTPENLQPLPLTDKQIESLKQKDAQLGYQ